MDKKIIFLLFAVLFFASCNILGDQHVVWKFKTNFPGKARPVVSGKQLYVGSDKFYCLDAVKGTVVWDFSTFAMIKSQAVVQDGYVYFQSGGLYCLDAVTGELVWEFWAGAWSDLAPVIDGRNIYSLVKNRLYCLDVKTGKELWHMKSSRSTIPPIVSGDMIYIGGNGRIQCIDVKKRKDPRWLNVGRGFLRPSELNGRLYVTPVDNVLYSIDIKSSKIIWRYDFNASLVSSLLLTDKYLYAGNSKGEAFCFDVESGDVVWKTELGTSLTFASPVLSEGCLYIRTLNRMVPNPGVAINEARSFTMWGLEADTGRKLWNMEVPAGNFAVSNNLIYISPADYNLYCIKAKGDEG